ncbi:RNA polymerase sigma factor [Streptomyces sp. NPDC002851]
MIRQTADLVGTLRPLLSAEAAAEATGSGVDSGDLEQTVWLRLLERLDRGRPPSDPVRWLGRAVRAEAHRARRAVCHERPYAEEATAGPAVGTEPVGPEPAPERLALRAERRRVLRDAVGRLPGRCPRLVAAMMAPQDLTYREIAGQLGISQGSLGPERSRCLGCLRRILTAEVAAPGPLGNGAE